MNKATLDTGTKAERDFALALLDPMQAPPAGWFAHNGADVTPRLNVYRNNVMTSLRQALADSTPVLLACVGAQAFSRLALQYVRQHPPPSPVLHDFALAWPAFLAGCDEGTHGTSGAWMADLARLETARIRAYHAADEPYATIDDLQDWLLAPETLPQRQLALHPSATLLQSDWPVVHIWQTSTPPAEHAHPQSCLVSRVGHDAPACALDPATAAMIHALQQSRSLADAAERAFEADTTFSLPHALALLIRQRALRRSANPAADEPPAETTEP